MYFIDVISFVVSFLRGLSDAITFHTLATQVAIIGN